MVGHVLNSAEAREIENIAFEGVRVGSPWIGERHLHLPGDYALKADDAGHLDKDKRRLAADGKRLQKTFLVPLGVDGGRPARRATVLLSGLLDGEAGGPTVVIGGPVLVAAANAEHVVQ